MFRFEEVTSIQKRFLVTGLIILTLILKIILLPVRTGDYVFFLEPWMNFIRTHGSFLSLRYNFYNYSPAYIYFLVIITKISINPLWAVKLLSILFEYIAAIYLGKIVRLKYKQFSTLWCVAILPLIPTVLLNSGYLSQCDAIYAAFLLISLYYVLKDRIFLSVLFLGLSFSFKMQAAVLLPFYFVLLLRRQISWYYFVIVPLVYFLSLIPAWAMGRPLLDLIFTYLDQSNHYKFLTMNFPNIYIWVSNNYYDSVKVIGLGLTVVVTLSIGFWLRSDKVVLNYEHWIQLAFLSAILIPFLLPGMHERYMYVGDVLALLYYLVFRKNPGFFIGIVSVSLYSYIRCSRFNDVLPMWPAFIVYTMIICLVCYDFYKSICYVKE